mmetsp:Transcript_7704/g.14284  ORF Transcript_7704/g.14284 Transcript_7704/m.14284 type:complete len:83 (+) Transcript_7704:125-373(+)
MFETTKNSRKDVRKEGKQPEGAGRDQKQRRKVLEGGWKVQEDAGRNDLLTGRNRFVVLNAGRRRLLFVWMEFQIMRAKKWID